MTTNDTGKEMYDLLNSFKYPRCPVKEHNVKKLKWNRICTLESCARFFQPICQECNESHGHETIYNRGLKSVFTELIETIKGLRDDYIPPSFNQG